MRDSAYYIYPFFPFVPSSSPRPSLFVVFCLHPPVARFIFNPRGRNTPHREASPRRRRAGEEMVDVFRARRARNTFICPDRVRRPVRIFYLAMRDRGATQIGWGEEGGAIARAWEKRPPRTLDPTYDHRFESVTSTAPTRSRIPSPPRRSRNFCVNWTRRGII